jgi:hypothetical protein
MTFGQCTERFRTGQCEKKIRTQSSQVRLAKPLQRASVWRRNHQLYWMPIRLSLRLSSCFGRQLPLSCESLNRNGLHWSYVSLQPVTPQICSFWTRCKQWWWHRPAVKLGTYGIL